MQYNINPMVFLLLSSYVFILSVTGVFGSGNLSCPSYCKTCADNGSCSSCENGKYGETCDNNCSTHCVGVVCLQKSGLCTEGCQTGSYQSGPSCSPCPGNCNSCLANGCDQCKDGFYGSHCQEKCSDCVQGKCTKHHCSLECNIGLYPETQPNYFIDELYRYCRICRWPCRSCNSSKNCSSCVDGRWGTACQDTCSGDCKTCDKSTGKCLPTHCNIGEYMTPEGLCSSCPANCKSCNSSVCTECNGQFYGNRCDIFNCSSIRHCHICYYNASGFDFESLTCSKCEKDYYGDQCQSNCSVGCNATNHKDEPNCEQFTGTCLNGCDHGFWGKLCNETCSTGCSDNCDTVDGHCMCIDGYAGDRCDTTYSPSNENRTENSSNATNQLAVKAKSESSLSTTEIACLAVGICLGLPVIIMTIGCIFCYRRRAQYEIECPETRELVNVNGNTSIDLTNYNHTP